MDCWSNIVGNERAVTILRTLARQHDPPPAVLLHGPSGSGKTLLAQCFAAAWHNGLEETGWLSEPWRMVSAAASRERALRLVDDWLDTPPTFSRATLIINEANELLIDQRRLLALLAGEGVRRINPIVLCSVHGEDAAYTNDRSRPIWGPELLRRVHRVATAPVTPQVMKAYLRRRCPVTLPDEVLRRIVDRSDGAVGQALPLLDVELAARGHRMLA